MESDKFKILNNFLNESEELLESEFKEGFKKLREAYVNELNQPGCTQCIRNGCRNKYTQRIMGILNNEISIDAPPPPMPQRRQQPAQSDTVVRPPEPSDQTNSAGQPKFRPAPAPPPPPPKNVDPFA